MTRPMHARSTSYPERHVLLEELLDSCHVSASPARWHEAEFLRDFVHAMADSSRRCGAANRRSTAAGRH